MLVNIDLEAVPIGFIKGCEGNLSKEAEEITKDMNDILLAMKYSRRIK